MKVISTFVYGSVTNKQYKAFIDSIDVIDPSEPRDTFYGKIT